MDIEKMDSTAADLHIIARGGKRGGRVYFCVHGLYRKLRQEAEPRPVGDDIRVTRLEVVDFIGRHVAIGMKRGECLLKKVHVGVLLENVGNRAVPLG